MTDTKNPFLPVKEIQSDRFWFLCFLIIGLFGLTSLILIILKRPGLPPQVPLFYSRPWGEEQLASKDHLFLIPITILGILIANLLLAGLLWKKSQFITKILIGLALICSFLIALTLIKIIFLV